MARWVFAAASVVGTAHKARGEACQDRHAVERGLSDERVLIAVVSDGAGSAPFGGEGADIVCAVLATEIQSYLAHGGGVSQITRDLALQWLACVRAEISNRPGGGGDLSRLACTTLVGIIDAEAAAFVQIGDGAIVIQRAPTTSGTPSAKSAQGIAADSCTSESQSAVSVGELSAACLAGLEVVVWPQQGEYVNTTRFVTNDDYQDAVEVVVYQERIDGVALFTDGLQHLLLDYSGQQAHPPFFMAMFDQLRTAATGEYDQDQNRDQEQEQDKDKDQDQDQDQDQSRDPDHRAVKATSAALAAYLDGAAINDRTQDDKTLVIAIRSPRRPMPDCGSVIKS